VVGTSAQVLPLAQSEPPAEQPAAQVGMLSISTAQTADLPV
jgi:hypothetical protein